MEGWRWWMTIEDLKNKNLHILFFPLNSIASNKCSCLILLSWHRDQEESKEYACLHITFALHFRVERPLINLILYELHCMLWALKHNQMWALSAPISFLSTSLYCSQHAQNVAFHQVDIIELIAFLKYFINSKWMKALGGCTMSTHTSRASCLILKWLLEVTY